MAQQERGVAPVISTILMVAVVVILAATISVFVLGLGENISDTGPTASFDTEQRGNVVILTHTGGETIEAANIDVRSAVWASSTDEISSGDTITVVPEASVDEITVTWIDQGMSSVLTTVAFDAPNLRTDPPTANTAANHTWEYDNLDFGESGNNGDEIDTITVDYPNTASFDGLNQDDITVTMTRTLSDGEDKSKISVNNGDYAGSEATFDLSGSYQTDIAGPIIVEITGIENPDAGSYTATITFEDESGEISVSRTEKFTIVP